MPHYGIALTRENGHRSTYTVWNKGEDYEGEFIVIKHWLPQPLNWPNAPLEGEFPYGPNDANTVEGKYPGIAISKEDWPEFSKWIHDIYEQELEIG